MKCTQPHNHDSLHDAVALLNDKWMIETLHHIRHGSKRFGVLRKLMPGISPKTLTERLRQLEKQRLITRNVLVAKAPQHIEYELTDKGYSLGAAMRTLSDWHSD